MYVLQRVGFACGAFNMRASMMRVVSRTSEREGRGDRVSASSFIAQFL